MESIVVFSHLRWNFVYQRPQHLLSRLAAHYRILFVEEPEYRQGAAAMEISSPLPNLTICRPFTPVTAPGFHPAQMPHLQAMARQLSADFTCHYAWFYTPMALPLLPAFQPCHVIYDCMDELSAFKNPPPQLVARENELLQIADLVFTGGPSLYHAKKQRHANVHCFPSSVDVSHFHQALNRNLAHESQRLLHKPRLGFYGVIDERFDIGLIEHMADTHPEWQIVLVGPVVKIDPQALAQRSNIHYLGQQPYDVLPHFLAAWDVCLMPFVINESTRFISPTKTLEYMAAELPIVSTPVKDVVDLHSDVVEIATTAAEFVAACERVFALPNEKMQNKIRLMRQKLSKTSWNITAANMQAMLKQLDAAGRAGSTGTVCSPLSAGAHCVARATSRDIT